MSKTLTLTLEAPMMSFGSEETPWATYKGTSYYPTKTAIVGMIGCAFGYQKNSNEINNLSKNIKVLEDSIISYYSNEKKDDLQEDLFFSNYMSGLELLEDYQIVSTKRIDQYRVFDEDSGFDTPDGNKKKGNDIVHKFYITNIGFKVTIEAEDTLIDDIYYALRHPYYPYYIGRSCCIPSKVVV